MNLLARFSTYSWMPTSALNKLIIIGFRSNPFSIRLIKFETKANIPSRITSWILTWCRGFKTSLFALSPTCCNLFEYKHWKIVECPGHWYVKSFTSRIDWRLHLCFTITQYTIKFKRLILIVLPLHQSMVDRWVRWWPLLLEWIRSSHRYFGRHKVVDHLAWISQS